MNQIGRNSALTPTVFISYSWDSEEHQHWIETFSKRLTKAGVKVDLDRWDIAPGDMIPHFMERIQRSDFVLIICTPNYKQKSDTRCGGVGYESNIITAELYVDNKHRKFIPLLRVGPWREAAPIWLLGACYLDLQGNPYKESVYLELIDTLFRTREPHPQTPTKFSQQHTHLNPLNIMSLIPEDLDDK